MTESTPNAPVAILTGAGSGIGREVARILSREGYNLVLVARRREPLEDTARLCQSDMGTECLVLPLDVGLPASARAMVDAALERFARLDALILNAGTAPLLPIDRHTPEIIEDAFRTNALAPAYAIAAAWPVFSSRKSGRIVCTSTMGTDDPFPGFFAYAAAKSAVNSFVRSCEREGKRLNIRAFAVAPGAVETPMLRAIFSEQQIPAQKTLTPEAVARVIADCALGRRDADSGTTIFVPSP
ncbi:MAG: SDR family oxidoreductase [Phycisphaerales bacterium]|jgi:NAD(P)-dependent dehydrogenase (short-subunit alcohol dehydrogenase family)|nr:SDR family oxidoreductase [Phycisphaerales bacterium]